MNLVKKIFAAVAAMVSTASMAQGFTSLSVEEFEKAIKSDSVQLVDVRTSAEYAAGHIAGAMNIDVKDTAFVEKAVKLDKAKSVAVYCRSGKRSKMAAGKLVENGYKVIELNTGILGWQKEEKKVVKD